MRSRRSALAQAKGSRPCPTTASHRDMRCTACSKVAAGPSSVALHSTSPAPEGTPCRRRVRARLSCRPRPAARLTRGGGRAKGDLARPRDRSRPCLEHAWLYLYFRAGVETWRLVVLLTSLFCQVAAATLVVVVAAPTAYVTADVARREQFLFFALTLFCVGLVLLAVNEATFAYNVHNWTPGFPG